MRHIISNLTCEQLGELVGVSKQAINAIETEKFEPSIWLAYDISKVFNCAIEDVFLFKESKRKSRAPQIGILKRLVVIDMGQGLIKLVNPKIISQEGEQEVIEGCLSIPNTFGKVKRPAKVTVQALNEDGEEITLAGTGDLAKCFCHEIDHLEGILFTDLITKSR